MYLRPKELAKNIGVSQSAIYKWLVSGQLKSNRVGAAHHITPEQWAAFLESCQNRRTKKIKAAAEAA